MQNNLVFYIPIYTEENSILPKPINENYDYWFPLIEYFLKKADLFEIHCWDVENETLEQIKSLDKNQFEIVKDKNITIFKGQISSSLSAYLLNNHKNDIGEFKWFSVNLYKGMEHVFHSGHWGTELFVHNVTEKEIEFIKGITPTETSFLQY